jgi:hypothetical protein
MNKYIIAGVIVFVVVLAGLFLPSLFAAAAKGNAKSRCEQVQVAYQAALAAQNAPEIRRLEDSLAECNRDLAALGVAIDPGEESVKACTDAYARTEDWWTIYINTDWSDTLKRNNNYAAIVQATKDLAACVRDALSIVRTPAGLNAAQNVIDRAIRDCNARKSCNLGGGFGCGRQFGIYTEPHPNDRAKTEEDLINEFLAPTYQAINVRRAAMTV